MGQSYGGGLATHVGYYFQQQLEKNEKKVNFAGMLLACPAIDGDIPPYPVVFVLRYLLTPFFPKWTPFFMPHPVSSDRVWKDPEAKALHMSPDILKTGLGNPGQPFCLGTGCSMLDSVETLQKEVISNINIPFCVIHGTDDYCVLPSGTDMLVKQCQTPVSDRAVNMKEGAYHDLFSELDAEDNFQFLLDWLLSRL
mmetsp:Transcript_14563/g.19019  ORF Transcript_14563/g.19019 Transcript_14563/m.19019 type:complete len:196 (-) Transcript_14563:147-734(-)